MPSFSDVPSPNLNRPGIENRLFRFNDWQVYSSDFSGVRCHIFLGNRHIAYVDVTGRIEIMYRVRIPIRVLRFVGAHESYIEACQARNRQGRNRCIIDEEVNVNDIFFNRTFGIEIEAFHPSDFYIKDHIKEALEDNGLECSIEDYNHRNSTTHWKITTDSSIHGEYTFELVSPILKGEDGFTQIKAVCKVLKDLGVQVNRSCGLHVHHQANDLNQNIIKNCFNYYKNNETILDSLMPNSRRENHGYYCQSLNDVSIRSWKRNRYYKINYCSYSRHSTIEFRHHSGTIEFNKIKHWIILTQRLLLRPTTAHCNSLPELLSDVGITNHEWYINRQIYVTEHLIT